MTYVQSARSILPVSSHEDGPSIPFPLVQMLAGPPSAGRNPLDRLYTVILRSALDGPQAQNIILILQILLRLSTPISMDAWMKLVGRDRKGDVALLLRPLLSVVHVSQDSGTVCISHPSFRNLVPHHHPHFEEFGRASDNVQQNMNIAIRRLLSIMQDTLRFNIYQLEMLHMHSLDIAGTDNSEQAQYLIPPELLYACRCWGGYVGGAASSEILLSKLREFLSHHLLHWMEVLNQNN